METQTLLRGPQIAARLIELDAAISTLQTERFALLAEQRVIDMAEGISERQTAVTVAQLSRSSTRAAGAQIRMSTKLSELPLVAAAFREGVISFGQLDDVITIATPETQAETILLAQQSSIVELHRAALVRRGRLTEDRERAQKERYLSFTKYDEHVSVHGSLPFLEGDH